jgi:hypothetical protein
MPHTLFTAEALAPARSNAWTAAMCPPLAARCKAVLPSCIQTVGSYCRNHKRERYNSANECIQSGGVEGKYSIMHMHAPYQRRK